MVLAGLLLIGSVTGAQLGTRIAQYAKPELLRLMLAAIVLAVALAWRSGSGCGRTRSTRWCRYDGRRDCLAWRSPRSSP